MRGERTRTAGMLPAGNENVLNANGGRNFTFSSLPGVGLRILIAAVIPEEALSMSAFSPYSYLF